MKKIISTDKAPAAVGPYSQAVEVDGTLYISGQLPLNPSSGQMPASIEEQTHQCLQNISVILTEAGYTVQNVVKSTVLLDDLSNFQAMNSVYSEFYTKDMPARVCYQVAKLPMNAKIEIETIAVK